jgi:uncharacterized membrane protein
MRLRAAEIALAVAALLVAAFLTWERARGRAAPCPIGGGGCETVAQSRWSELGGIPVSVFGMAGAATLLGTFAWRSPLAIPARFTIAGIGAVFSLYLTFLEATEINAYCIYCLGSAAAWCLLALLSGTETARSSGSWPDGTPERG